MADNLAQTLGEAISDKNNMKQELVDQGGTPVWVNFLRGNITPRTLAIIQNKMVVSSSASIVGSPTQGSIPWNVGASYDSKDWVRVTSPNNLFEDYLEVSTFVDSSTATGTYSGSTYTYILDGSQLFQTREVALNNQAYKKATVSLNGTNITNGNLYISFDGGSTWNSATNNTQLQVTNVSTNGIKIKLENNTSGTTFGASGLAFPISFSGSVQIIITDYSVSYST